MTYDSRWMICVALAAGCGGGGGSVPDTVPEFDAANFSDPLTIDNPYWPLVPNTTAVYFEAAADGPEIIVVEVLDETRTVAGVTARVVRDRVFVDGLVIEDTHDWYAQDDAGNVWYMGEAVQDYVYDDAGNLVEMTTEGSWEAGVDGALPGYQMLAEPRVGTVYHQEYLREEAEDAAEILELAAPVTLADGTQYAALETRDYSTVDPELDERKYYARGLGVVRTTQADGTEPGELLGVFDVGQPAPAFDPANFTAPTTIDNPLLPLVPGTTLTYEGAEERIEYEITTETRVVAGVTCVTVNDRAYDGDDRLLEDTHDWFAQDDDGNVWYMGETVDVYNYDDAGQLIDITHEGSWEAGVGGAAPGIQMYATPPVRTSYRQELLPQVAEDMGFVIRTDATITLSGGTTYDNCTQILDWVPLEPSAVEYKYYAPGVGLVYSTHVDVPEEAVELGP